MDVNLILSIRSADEKTFHWKYTKSNVEWWSSPLIVAVGNIYSQPDRIRRLKLFTNALKIVRKEWTDSLRDFKKLQENSVFTHKITITYQGNNN